MPDIIHNKRELIDYKISWLAKKKGFEWATKYAFNILGERIIADADDREGESYFFTNDTEEHACSPTRGMLSFWLKIKHNKFVEITNNKYSDESFLKLLEELNDIKNIAENICLETKEHMYEDIKFKEMKIDYSIINKKEVFKCMNCKKTNINKSNMDKNLCDFCWHCLIASTF